MQIRLINELTPGKIAGFAKFRKAIESDDFFSADVHKAGAGLYSARLGRKSRLLFSLRRQAGEVYCLVLEYLPNHEYEKSRFLERGAVIDEDRSRPLAALGEAQAEEMNAPNTGNSAFHLLDKILFLDDTQQSVYNLPPPLVVIGSAGSGKTALVLEKMRAASGDILYVSLSSFLVESAHSLYFAHNYRNDDQEVQFLSFRELLETMQVPAGGEMTFREFEGWFIRHKRALGLNNPHTVFEEFRGVITGQMIEASCLSREEYLSLGVKQSIFSAEERPAVYELFQRYLEHLRQTGRFDPNILSHQYLSLAAPCFDFIVIDEVQDITNIQLYLILKTLRSDGQFLLCGDSNQIVHPNFFSWSGIKTLFFENRSLTGHGEIIRVLHTNYRNTPAITELANTILKLKHLRFGSIDRESNYLVNSVGKQTGEIRLLRDTGETKRDLDAKTSRSTRFAVLVMHPRQKAEAQRWFNTPLVFSIQEAKGLEYENVILFNFISGEARAFREIAEGVNPKALLEQQPLVYGRARDKRDKSLEIYKFFINALYVGATRGVRNLYLVESQHRHPAIEVLRLIRFSGELSLEQQDSSIEEWQKEARKLEQQGKQEQAEAIRRNVLHEQAPPWRVLDRAAFAALRDQVVNAGGKKGRLLVMECALINDNCPALNMLRNQGFKAAGMGDERGLKQLHRNHYMAYDLKNTSAVMKDVERYGVDHRTMFNLTPLMVASRLGNSGLVTELIQRGANPALVANNGLNALQICLQMAVPDPRYARGKAGSIYSQLRQGLSVQADSRLIKLHENLMSLFILHLMSALFYRHLGKVASYGLAFTARDISEFVQGLPERVLPERRKRQAYISSVLSGNEVHRDAPYNRKLFFRIRRGHYIINPNLKLRLGEDWMPIHDLLKLEDLGYPLPPAEVVARWKANSRRVWTKGSFEAIVTRDNEIFNRQLDRFRDQVRGLIVTETPASDRQQE